MVEEGWGRAGLLLLFPYFLHFHLSIPISFFHPFACPSLTTLLPASSSVCFIHVYAYVFQLQNIRSNGRAPKQRPGSTYVQMHDYETIEEAKGQKGRKEPKPKPKPKPPPSRNDKRKDGRKGNAPQKTNNPPREAKPKQNGQPPPKRDKTKQNEVRPTPADKTKGPRKEPKLVQNGKPPSNRSNNMANGPRREPKPVQNGNPSHLPPRDYNNGRKANAPNMPSNPRRDPNPNDPRRGGQRPVRDPTYAQPANNPHIYQGLQQRNRAPQHQSRQPPGGRRPTPEYVAMMP